MLCTVEILTHSILQVYFRNVHPKFPEGGKLSQHLESLKIGETVDFRGPSGRLVYNGRGKFSIKLLRKEPPTEYTVSKVRILATKRFFHTSNYSD